MKSNLPETPESFDSQVASEIAFKKAFFPTFIPRMERSRDLGVDGTIEARLTDPETQRRYGTNRRASFQLKSAKSPKRLPDGSVTYRLETKNLKYLLGSNLAFYVLFVEPDELYFRWHHEIVIEHPGWADHKEVRVNFNRKIDSELLKEIEDEIHMRAAQIQVLRDGPGFIRNFRGEHIPWPLKPVDPFVNRSDELATLENRLRPGTFVPIVGPPEYGKSQLVGHLLADKAALDRLAKRFTEPLGLLVVDLGGRIGDRRVLRSLGIALGFSKVGSFTEIDWQEETSTQQARSSLFSQVTTRLQQISPIIVFENLQEIFPNAADCADLGSLLRNDVFKDGAAILISRSQVFPTMFKQMELQAEVTVNELPNSEAIEFLGTLVQDHDLAVAALNLVAGDSEVLVPGVLRRGVKIFQRRATSSETSKIPEILAESLIDAAGNIVRKVFEEFGPIIISTETGALGLRGTLLVLSILPEFGVTEKMLKDAGLPCPPFGLLSEFGWVENVGTAYRLGEVTQQVLRTEVRELLSNQESAEAVNVKKGLDRLLQSLEKTAAVVDSDGFVRAVEEALAWASREIAFDETIRFRLLKALLPFSVDDLVFPLSKKESDELSARLRLEEGFQDLSTEVANSVIESRFGVDVNLFLKYFAKSTDVAAKVSTLLPHYVRALDMIAFIGTRRFRRYREIFEIRKSLLDRLLKDSVSSGSLDVGYLQWCVSWFLNTSALALGIGQLEEARRILDNGKLIFLRLPLPTELDSLTTWLWLRARVCALQGAAESGIEARIRNFREATASAADAFLTSGRKTWLLRFYLRSVQRLVTELRTDTDRVDAVNAAIERLEQEYGPSKWPLGARSHLAALIRDEAALHFDSDLQLLRAQKALDFFRPLMAAAVEAARLGDTRSLLVLARIHAFLARCQVRAGQSNAAIRSRQEAMRLCKIALDYCQSASAWELRLRLLDEDEEKLLSREWDDGYITGRGLLSSDLRNEIKACRNWLKNLPVKGESEGRLALWCLDREWRAQGSLERLARSSHTNYERLDANAKQQLLRRLYRERRAKLVGIEKEFGPFLDIYLSDLRNEGQFQRLFAIYGSHQCNIDPVMSILKTAQAYWPDNHHLVAEEARFQRYIWNYAEAICGFRQVAVGTPNGQLRREVIISLVETLLVAATHCDSLTFPDGTKMEARLLIEEARQWLGQVVGFRSIAQEVAILRDRIEFEAGTPIEWTSIDAAYKLIIGDIEAYTQTVVKNLDELLTDDPDLPERLADAVRQNWTSSTVLQWMGSLYLRRAETAGGIDPLSDSRRAYAIFNACRILERSWLGTELATTSYQRGRSIVAAALICRNSNPFPAHLEGKKNLLHLAEARFQSAVSRSVGLFHVEAKRRASECARLRKAFGG